ncbi:MAG: alpha/beta fold hydrolase [Clostridia bacterium]|nr:alpha/beta fold hydrolase [Clostridia bacterium]
MKKEYLFSDPVFGESELPRDEELIIKGKRGKLFCMLYLAGGAEKKPSVLLLHGLPGNEQNLDLAQSLRRTGINVMTLHYSGSWGSEGRFSFRNCIEDCITALEYLKDAENAEKYLIDTTRIYIMGLSMGGFLTLYLAASCPGIAGAVGMSVYDFGFTQRLVRDRAPELQSAVDAAMNDNAMWLSCSGGDLSRELIDNTEDFDLEKKADALSKIPLLIVTAKRDEISVPERHGRRLYDAIRAAGGTNAVYKSIDSNHSFTDRRIELINTVADQMERWLG